MGSHREYSCRVMRFLGRRIHSCGEVAERLAAAAIEGRHVFWRATPRHAASRQVRVMPHRGEHLFALGLETGASLGSGRKR